MIAGAVGFALLTGAFLVFIFYIGTAGVPVEVLAGAQLPTDYLETIRETGVLDDDEDVVFFYSDALMDIRDGFYLLTDRKVVVYSATYSDPAIPVPFDDIRDLEVEFDDSFLADSTVWITRSDGSTVSFPLSSERGGDKRFYEALEVRWKESGDREPVEE